MCRASFSGWKVKGQGHTGCSNYNHVCSVASSLFDGVISYVTYMQHMRGTSFVICPLCIYMPIWLTFGGWVVPQLFDP